MSTHSMLVLPTIGLGFLLNSDIARNFGLYNICIQLAVFVLLAHIPGAVTGRMSYVDIAWPAGLVGIGILAKVYAADDSDSWRENLVFVAYLFQGGRMFLGALLMASHGHLEHEMNRYVYQRIRWERRGITEAGTPLAYKLTLQLEIFVQAMANMGVLCVPAALLSQGFKTDSLSWLEICGWVVWVSGYAIEHTADMQKRKFVLHCQKNGIRKAVCDVGLWNYSRHPNYFGEWMVWNGLVITCIPTVQTMFEGWDGALSSTSDRVSSVGLTFALVACSYCMYSCLTSYTGAVPAEHYSVQSRPGYRLYQQEVNMFFPGPRRVTSPLLNSSSSSSNNVDGGGDGEDEAPAPAGAPAGAGAGAAAEDAAVFE